MKPEPMFRVSCCLPMMALILLLEGCSAEHSSTAHAHSSPVLTLVTTNDGADADFEMEALNLWTQRHGLEVRYLPDLSPASDQSMLYRELFRLRSPQPDLVTTDVIWSGLLADDLVDLRPVLGKAVEDFPPQLIEAFSANGRLTALPTFAETGLLYYRTDLLTSYGFKHPPATWYELEIMAARIQAGERAKGNGQFWGWVWEGGPGEALTCDAYEWQISQGGGHIVEADGRVSIYNPNAVRAVERAVRWVGTISPRGVTAYSEEDPLNIWQAGNAAFLRSWTYAYGEIMSSHSPLRDKLGVAVVPGGARALGGIGIGVSKYSEHRSEAISALLWLTSKEIQERRWQKLGSWPTRTLLQKRADLTGTTPFHGLMAEQALAGVEPRPAAQTGKSYLAVSQAYFRAVNLALTKRKSADDALRDLQTELTRILQRN